HVRRHGGPDDEGFLFERVHGEDSLIWSMILFRKTVSTFRDHAPAVVRTNKNPAEAGRGRWTCVYFAVVSACAMLPAPRRDRGGHMTGKSCVPKAWRADNTARPRCQRLLRMLERLCVDLGRGDVGDHRPGHGSLRLDRIALARVIPIEPDQVRPGRIWQLVD